MNLLEEFANKYGTDKGTVGANGLSPKNYTKTYYSLLAHLRAEPVTVLEIGVQKGASLAMWKDFFSNGDVHGVDVKESCKQYESDRISVHVGSQGDTRFLDAMMRRIGKRVDIIIDDGSHRMSDQQISLTSLFPHVKCGGYYFIEDLHTAYWREYGGGYKARHSTIEFCKYMADQLNRKALRQRWGIMPLAQFQAVFDEVTSVQFFPSLVLIRK